MRKILSLSMSNSDVRQVKEITKKRGYNSVSSYIKYLLNADIDLISEKELLSNVREARGEYKKGKSVKAKSLSHLL